MDCAHVCPGEGSLDDHSNIIVRLRGAAGMMNTYWHVVVSEAEDGGAEVAAKVSVLEGGSVGEYGRGAVCAAKTPPGGQ